MQLSGNRLRPPTLPGASGGSSGTGGLKVTTGLGELCRTQPPPPGLELLPVFPLLPAPAPEAGTVPSCWQALLGPSMVLGVEEVPEEGHQLSPRRGEEEEERPK